jgi:alkylated DNA repair dioxygenase AlkB
MDAGPDGIVYRARFVTAGEESTLVDALAGVELSTFEMHGVAARRRVAFFGASYDRGRGDVPPIPPFLLELRARAAEWAGADAGAFAMALVNVYPPGAPIGWHRDAPQYDLVVGISLLASCRMMFRPYLSPADPRPPRRRATHEVLLERGSAYALSGDARYRFEHHIPPVASLRYSVTFRTRRRR